jgi:hypothetical protein
MFKIKALDLNVIDIANNISVDFVEYFTQYLFEHNIK